MCSVPGEKAHEIATRLGNLTRELHSTGAGVAVPVDAQRLCEIVHSAYSPRAAELIEQARANGQPAALRWDDIGPTAAIARQHSYWHRTRHRGREHRHSWKHCRF